MLKSFVVLSPLLHGRGGESFRLQPNQIVSCSLFTHEQASKLLSAGKIKPCSQKTEVKEPVPDKVAEPLPPIATMTAAEAKEIINAETNAVRLEKFKDAEGKREHPRKSVTDFLNSRIKELTGYEG